MNKVELIGGITKDIEVLKTANGKEFARFTLAVRRDMPDKNNMLLSDFLNCVAWNDNVEVIRKAIKGTQISVVGTLRTGSYEKDGVKRYTTEILVSSVKLV